MLGDSSALKPYDELKSRDWLAQTTRVLPAIIFGVCKVAGYRPLCAI